MRATYRRLAKDLVRPSSSRTQVAARVSLTCERSEQGKQGHTPKGNAREQASPCHSVIQHELSELLNRAEDRWGGSLGDVRIPQCRTRVPSLALGGARACRIYFYE